MVGWVRGQRADTFANAPLLRRCRRLVRRRSVKSLVGDVFSDNALPSQSITPYHQNPLRIIALFLVVSTRHDSTFSVTQAAVFKCI